MASLSDIRRRIGSVKNTRQITRAMKLVAGAKLKRATDAALAAKPYQEALSTVLERVVQSAGDVSHPLLEVPKNDTDVLVVLMTSDRGLCGGFNGQLNRATLVKIKELEAAGKKVTVLGYGKKGPAFLKSRAVTMLDPVIDLNPAEYGDLADALANRLVEMMGEDAFSACYLAFNEYKSVMNQVPQFRQILPMKLEVDDNSEGTASGGYSYEPSGNEILGDLLPKALRTRLLQAFLESQAGEQASRMTAMDSATRNASELIDDLTLVYNRARQAAITKELIEIVSGAEAL